MIKFFRRIRQNLLMENKTSKYFKYAIGEIILVVIGILIALQINNWNEKRKNDSKIATILKEIQKDLLEDILKSKELFAYYKTHDSIIQLALDKKLSREDYLGNNRVDYVNVAVDAFHMKIHSNGYKKLTDNLDNIPEKYQDLIAPLNEIYTYDKYEIDKFDARIDKVTDRLMDDFAASKTWYYRWSQNQISDEAVNYFLNDSLYKNALAIYSNASINLRNNVSSFSSHASELYRNIAELTGDPKIVPDFIPHHLIEPTDQELEAITGNYTLVKIKNDNGNITQFKHPFTVAANKKSIQIIDVKYDNTYGVYFKSSTELYDEQGTSPIIKNDKGEVVSILLRFINAEYELMKME
ncbi:MAG: hypothetical protein ACI8ZO_000952 [Flavobacteriales bacterium]|jgi:hypothetical protein